PVVSGTIALMLQANPSLTPNLVKGILEFTAETHVEYTGLIQGAGFLNARGAVELAQKMAEGTAALDANTPQNDPTPWGRHVIWGNELVGGDALAAVAMGTNVAWGATAVPGETVVRSAAAGGDGDPSAPLGVNDIVWGTNLLDAADDVVWSLHNSQLPTPNSQRDDVGIAELGVDHRRAERRP